MFYFIQNFFSKFRIIFFKKSVLFYLKFIQNLILFKIIFQNLEFF